jgi:hypothetical protein
MVDNFFFQAGYQSWFAATASARYIFLTFPEVFSPPFSAIYTQENRNTFLFTSCYWDLLLFNSWGMGALSLNTTLPSFATY